MPKLGLLVATIAALLGARAAAAPLEVYGKLPSIEDAALSPSGEYLGLIWTDGEERNIVVQRLSDKQITYAARAGNAKLRSVQWAGDRHLIITNSVTGTPIDVIAARSEWFMAFDIDLQTKKLKPLLRDVGNSMNTILDDPEVRMVNGEPVVFLEGIYFVNNRGRHALFKIDLDRATGDLVEAGLEDTRDWLVAADGTVLAQTLYDGKSGRWGLRLKSGRGWLKSAGVDTDGPPALLGLGRDGKSVLVAATEDDLTRWREVARDGTWGEGTPIVDNQRAIHDPKDGHLIGHYALVDDEDRYTFFDPLDDRVWKAVAKAFPGDRVRLSSWSSDRTKILVRVDSATLGPAYSLVDLNTRNATWIGSEYAKLREGDLAEQRPISLKAQDGLELTGYLTLPAGRPAKGLPLVGFAHGGPAARDTPGFDWWAQAMASRGYAVMQLNYRGSDGFGWDFTKAGFGEWGRKMQTDLSDGVRHLAKAGTIDPKRVCIVGASYGGYAALAGAAFDHGVYRCAASVAGPADLRRQVDFSRDRAGVSALRYWTRYMGAKDLRDPVLAQISPAANADKVDIPVLLVHGKDDTVVPLVQSRLMADALKKAGKPVELVVQNGSDHWLSRGDTRLAMLQAVVTFLEKNNPPK
ncbi:MAG: S9 family peptidase [Phenylobacterium sp.]